MKKLRELFMGRKNKENSLSKSLTECFQQHVKSHPLRKRIERHLIFRDNSICSDFVPEYIPKIVDCGYTWDVYSSYDDMRGPGHSTYTDMDEAVTVFISALENYIEYPNWSIYYHQNDSNWEV